MKQKFAVFDIDGTVFRNHLIHELMFECVQLELLPKTFESQLQPSLQAWRNRMHDRAWMEYQTAFDDAVTCFESKLSHDDFVYASNKLVKRMSGHVYVYTRNLIARLKREGYILLAISGSPEALVASFAQEYEFDDWVGARHESRKGRVHIIDWPEMRDKGEILQDLVQKHSLTWDDSIGVGDTMGDSAMLSLVKQPIAFNPNRELLQHAHRQGWKVVIERKNVHYELIPHQGKYTLAV